LTQPEVLFLQGKAVCYIFVKSFFSQIVKIIRPLKLVYFQFIPVIAVHEQIKENI